VAQVVEHLPGLTLSSNPVSSERTQASTSLPTMSPLTERQRPPRYLVREIE
jgi:hypothetical protein